MDLVTFQDLKIEIVTHQQEMSTRKKQRGEKRITEKWITGYIDVLRYNVYTGNNIVTGGYFYEA